jgi:hypothetical protein
MTLFQFDAREDPWTAVAGCPYRFHQIFRPSLTQLCCLFGPRFSPRDDREPAGAWQGEKLPISDGAGHRQTPPRKFD